MSHSKNKTMILSLILGLSSIARAEVSGDVKTFTSPNGLTEKCIALEKIPGAKYSKGDIEKEQKFCAIDFYNNSVALCPKTWSTSPGTIINDNSKTGKSSVATEAAVCSSKNTGLDSIAKFKQTMNQPNTSGTYSYASLLYYHFSRILDTAIDVPVAVYRTMDKDEHYKRVSSKARPAPTAKMNVAGWDVMKAAELNPQSYGRFAIDVFTPDFKQIKGAIAKSSGTRYGVEINGTRASGWGNGQNYDFQKTPAFYALQSSLPIQQAFEEGFKKAVKDPTMAKAFTADMRTSLGRPSDTQMALWMKEVSEIAILDYIMSQQDRIGNIDFKWVWIYQDPSGAVKMSKVDSELGRTSMGKITPPKEIAALNPVLVQKTALGDNDAGGMGRYANFTKATGMLDGIPSAPAERAKYTHDPIRHLSPETYRRLVNLAKDMSVQGPAYQALVRAFDMNANIFNTDRMKGFVVNTQEVANIFIKACQNKTLRLDIPDAKDAYLGKFDEHTVTDCANP